LQIEAAAVAALEKAESEASAGGGRQYMNMLLQLLRLRQACNHPWLVEGPPGAPGGFGGGTGGGGKCTATAAEVAAVRRLAADSQAALLQVGVILRRGVCVGGGRGGKGGCEWG
jgi:hypothetical protein